MPKLEAKIVQRELDQGDIWPIYWLYGSEKMKARELLKRIRTTVLGPSTGSTLSLSEQILEGAEVDGVEIADAAKSIALGGGTRFIVIKDAHAVKETEALMELFGPRSKKADLPCVCVFLSKDLDARKKFSKALIEKAAVVACEEIPEDQREAWIGYLAKRRGLELTQALVLQLSLLDPWNLDIVDQELEKYSVALEGDGTQAEGVVLVSGAAGMNSDQFIEAFFSRKLEGALPHVARLADSPDEALPLLGLLSWNVRQLSAICSGARGVKINPYLAEKLNRWSRNWTFGEIEELQSALTELDFGIKQTPLLPLGLWAELVGRFAKSVSI